MKHVKPEKVAYLAPDVEIAVRTGEHELAAVAFYATHSGTWDVLVGVSSPSSRGHISTVLRWAADAVEEAAFAITGLTDDENDREEQERFNELPF